MTVVIFLSVLLGAIAIGVPSAYALILCGVALMFHLDMFDAQIIGQNLINGANSFALMAVPFFLLAGERQRTRNPAASGSSSSTMNSALPA